ncbi:MAG: SAM-dependent chlorinase/fluorinase, partial [Acidobacteriota bacterium]
IITTAPILSCADKSSPLAEKSSPPLIAPASPATLLFITDFGATDDSVAICKGVMLGIEPSLRIIDISHQVTPYSILDGARFLAGTSPYYGAGTVFVAVIDPGVGSIRKPLVVKSKRGQYFVLPDNGLITLVQDRDGIEGAREITNNAWMVGSALSSTFHGRDIFSSVGAHLARGEDWTKVGPEIKELARLPVKAAQADENGLSGEVIALDGPYGNLVTNIDAEDFQKLGYTLGEKLTITIAGKAVELPFVKTFSDVAENKPLLYVDSRGHLALAINLGNFAKIYKVTPPQPITIPRKAKP